MGSNKDKKYRNRSRSRSKSSKRKDERSHKKKSHKKNHKKKKSNKSLSKSRSRSRSYDNRIQRKEKNSINNDIKDIKQSPENKQEQKGQQKTNIKLDTNQLKETEIKLKQIDKTGSLKPKLMTEFLSSKEAQQLAKQDYQYEIEQQKDPITGQIIQVRVFKPYECKYKDCFYRFKNENELQQHMKLHEFGKM
ncbi:hypothetical protein PPERSA_00957 [Pseudocohnilembus persalinus]|uniref:C2H2-type domain-containing protein n=1 Tax=Pseudocohnilembus persalinus TaxID=266149 RepID=A0A0V0R8H7_PSEPJ|nr:hypothetical protein PPERSA_00957 [Pseudocohnilembus persalinus]|eukprot:KRX10787.1 hypothetical protein PPERSA_00957 [Pseudocohnilembus persalinus]